MKRRPGEAGIFALADLVQGFLQMTQHMKLVVDDQGLRSISFLEGGVAERLPHVHDGQANFAGFVAAEPGKEGVHALLGAIFAAKPNGSATDQIADHDAVAVAFADGDFVDANCRGLRLAGTPQLFRHVLLVQLFDRVPIQEQLFGHCFDGTVPATSSHEEGKTFAVKRIVGEPIQTFALHGTTPGALDPANEEVEIDPLVATGKIPDPAWPLIVKGRRRLPTYSARRFFRRRLRVTTTAWESPKIPCTWAEGSNPGKR